MRHAYYSYSKEELVSNNPKLPVIVMEDNAAVFRSMAEEMTEYTSLNVMTQAATSILAQANERPSTVLQILQ